MNDAPTGHEESFDFSLEPRSFGPFKIGEQAYLIREATEAAHIAYRNATQQGMRMTEDTGGSKSVSVGDVSGADSVLVARCLFKLVAPPAPNASNLPVNEVPVGEAFLRTLPRRVFAKLYAKVRDLSGMDEEAETEDVLTKRIGADTAKLETLRKKVRVPGDGPSSIPSTSGASKGRVEQG